MRRVRLIMWGLVAVVLLLTATLFVRGYLTGRQTTLGPDVASASATNQRYPGRC